MVGTPGPNGSLGCEFRGADAAIFGLFLQDPDGVYQHGKMEDLPYLLPIFRLQGQPLRILM